ncbi:MAG: transcriptional repressor LexA [Bryobacteraceae bacterium]|nr:transcriptional repressor LexA [Bryobacteraceae bacterium]
MALTRRQKEVLDFICDFVTENGFSPSYEEIAGGLQLASLATVHKHIAALELKGYLRHNFNQSRSVDVSPAYREERRRSTEDVTEPRVALLGRIAAGSPVESFATGESLAFSDFAHNANMYALQVRGDSMIDDHICDGDYVLIERASEIHDGEIVVAVVSKSEATLKRFYREPNGMARLQPANAAMEPIVVPLEDLEIQGRLVAVLRKFR